MKKIGFLSFGHWSDHPAYKTRTASDTLLQSIELAVAAEEIGLDGAYFRVHHFAAQLASPFPLLSAIGAKTSKMEIGRDVKGVDKIGIIEADKRAIFGRSYAGEPDQLIRELAGDEAIQEADTLLLTIPNTLGVDYNVHVLSSILKHVAPGLGWR